MDDGAEPSPVSRWHRWWWRRPSGLLPARDVRTWVHPSELPSFDTIPAYDATAPMSSRRFRTSLILGSAVMVLTLGAVMLALRSSSAPATTALSNIAKTVNDLPAYAQRAATSAIELVITTNGHLSAAAAMVIAPGNLAVTTAPIPTGASITGSSQRDERFAVTLVSRDTALGFSIVRLGQSQTITPTDVLPAAATVLAISPFFTPRASSPEIAWATTTLGDPVVEQSHGIVSYLAIPSAPDLKGFVDALAVVPSGNVVAVLGANGQWYSAQYVTRVAQVVWSNGGCHGRLGIRGSSAQGGGVQVDKVLSQPATAFFHRGDIITSLNGTPMDSIDSLLEYLYAAPAQQRVSVQFLRQGHAKSAVVFLACRP